MTCSSVAQSGRPSVTAGAHAFELDFDHAAIDDANAADAEQPGFSEDRGRQAQALPDQPIGRRDRASRAGTIGDGIRGAKLPARHELPGERRIQAQTIEVIQGLERRGARRPADRADERGRSDRDQALEQRKAAARHADPPILLVLN